MREIYLDNAASTPVDPRVLNSYVRASEQFWANPSNQKHEHGKAAKKALDSARIRLGKALNLDPRGLIFTSGATEANNLALRGTASLFSGSGTLIVSAIEHPCVTESAKSLIPAVAVKTVAVNSDGVIDLDQLRKICSGTSNLKLISVMAVNNETGVIQPLAEIAEIAKNCGALLHTDAVQAIGKIPIESLQVADLISISGHKLFGPKGVGCLWVRDRVRLLPLILGGGQEAGIRSGTVPVPLIVAFAEAVELAIKESDWQGPIEKALRDLEAEIQRQISGALVNGFKAPRVKTISNISFPNQSLLIDHIQGLAVSAGSACGCMKAKPSKVLLAMGLPESLATNSIRISAGKFNSVTDIQAAKRILLNAAKMLK